MGIGCLHNLSDAEHPDVEPSILVQIQNQLCSPKTTVLWFLKKGISRWYEHESCKYKALIQSMYVPGIARGGGYNIQSWPCNQINIQEIYAYLLRFSTHNKRYRIKMPFNSINLSIFSPVFIVTEPYTYRANAFYIVNYRCMKWLILHSPKMTIFIGSWWRLIDSASGDMLAHG